MPIDLEELNQFFRTPDTDLILLGLPATKYRLPFLLPAGKPLMALAATIGAGLGSALSERKRPDRVSGCVRRKERVFDIATVVDALRRIVDGETVIDPTIVSRLLGRRREDPLSKLTPREREVLDLIAQGMSNRALASRLFVTSAPSGRT